MSLDNHLAHDNHEVAWTIISLSSRKVSELSDYFKLNEKRCEKLRLLGADGSNGVDLYTSDGGVARGVGISLVVSSYLGHSGARFHLHPRLVDKSGDESAVLLRRSCFNMERGFTFTPSLSVKAATSRECCSATIVSTTTGRLSRELRTKLATVCFLTLNFRCCSRLISKWC